VESLGLGKRLQHLGRDGRIQNDAFGWVDRGICGLVLVPSPITNEDTELITVEDLPFAAVMKTKKKKNQESRQLV
jgi:hypothetical protein